VRLCLSGWRHNGADQQGDLLDGDKSAEIQEDKVKVNKIDHICIAVRNLEEARKIWEPVLGKTKPDDAYIDEPEKINVARYWVGEVGFELMESTSPDGDVAKFIG
jgi:hypothetical protein